MNIEKAFGLVLKKSRMQKRLSQEQLALASCLDRTFISMLERGLRQPSLSSVVAISLALDLPPQELVRMTMEIMDEDN